jgi:hypothetical protein
MTDEQDQLRRELDVIRSERDALRRELGDLRAHASIALGILRREPGPEGLDVLSVPTGKAIIAAIRELVARSAPTDGGAAANGHRWLAIDDDILRGHKIQAVQKIRDEFGGGIHDALELLGPSYEQLRRDRPDDFAQDPATYWNGFYA